MSNSTPNSRAKVYNIQQYSLPVVLFEAEKLTNYIP